MKKMLVLPVAMLILLQPLNLPASQTAAIKNTLLNWNSDRSVHLEAYNFATLYPKAIYEKSYFGWIVLTATIVVAGAVSYMSAGAGAPAAASGVSTVASLIGGGGPGSYMAGLSAVGSLVGGNAMVGAAILNGISIGTIGTSSATTLTMATKAALLTDIALSGMTITSTKENSDLYYFFDIPLPEGIGSGRVRRLVDTIYNDKEEREDALEKKDMLKSAKMSELIEDRYAQGVSWLYQGLNEKKNLSRLSQEDLLVLGIMAYKMGYTELFGKALDQIDKLDSLRFSKPVKKSFLYYLRGIYALSSEKPNLTKALTCFEKSYREEPYVIEPYLASIMILGDDFKTNHEKIEDLIKQAAEHYDEDKYAGRSNLVSLYFKAGTLFLRNQKDEKAADYFEHAYDSLGFMTKHLPFAVGIKNAIQLQWAIALKHVNEKTSQTILDEVLKHIDNQTKKNEIKKLYNEGG